MQYLTVKQVAEILQTSETQVRGLINSGKVKAINIGQGKNRVYRIHPDSLNAPAQLPQPKPAKQKRIEVKQFV